MTPYRCWDPAQAEATAREIVTSTPGAAALAFAYRVAELPNGETMEVRVRDPDGALHRFRAMSTASIISVRPI